MAESEGLASQGTKSRRCRSVARFVPYDKQPTSLDVPEAYSVPKSAFLNQFKETLARSEDARDCETLLTGSSWQSWSEGHQEMGSFFSPTWPMSNVVDAPDFDLDFSDHMPRWRPVFSAIFHLHLYIPNFQLNETFSKDALPPPYLDFALACLASVASSKTPHEFDGIPILSTTYFDVGIRLYMLTLEADNREARTMESVIASALIATYGLLSAELSAWSKSSAMLMYSMTVLKVITINHYASAIPIARRLDIFNCRSTDGILEPAARRHSMIASYKYLVDVLLAVHMGTVPVLSTSELNIRLPVSGHSLLAVYGNLIYCTGPMPSDVATPDDAVLLLTALLSDLLFIQRSACPIGSLRSSSNTPRDQTGTTKMGECPYQTLSLSAEVDRQHNAIKRAFDRWLRQFESLMPRNVLALYYFCQICLACPQLPQLSMHAGYPPALQSHTPSDPDPGQNRIHDEASVSEEAMELAWLVLDNITTSRSENDVECAPIWSPIVLFFSALVVWRSVIRRPSRVSAQRGTVKMLALFSKELDQLPWPCCPVMSQTLENLIARG